MTCPSCGAQRTEQALECASCGLIFSKWEARKAAEKAAAPEKAAATAPGEAPARGNLAAIASGVAILLFVGALLLRTPREQTGADEGGGPRPRPRGSSGRPPFVIRATGCGAGRSFEQAGAVCRFQVVTPWGRIVKIDFMRSAVTAWTDDLGTSLGKKGTDQYLRADGEFEPGKGIDLPTIAAAGKGESTDKGEIHDVILETPHSPAAAAKTMSVSGKLRVTFAAQRKAGRVKAFEPLESEFGRTQTMWVAGVPFTVFDVERGKKETALSVKHAPPKGFYLETLRLVDGDGEDLRAEAGGGIHFDKMKANPVQIYRIRQDSVFKKRPPEVLERVIFEYAAWLDAEEFDIPFRFTAAVEKTRDHPPPTDPDGRQ